MNLFRHRWFVARLFIGVVLLALLASAMDWSRIGAIVRNASIPMLALFVVLAFADRIFMALKWRVLLLASNVPVSMSEAVRSYLVGSFVGMFFPTSVGGDIVRLFVLGIEPGRRETVAATIVVERIFAFLALMVLCLIAALALAAFAMQSVHGLLLAGLLAAALAAGLVWLSFHPLPLRRAALLPGKIGGSLRRIAGAYQQFRHNRRALGLYFGLSLAEHCLPVMCNYIAAVALGIEVNLVVFFVVIPVVLVFARLPISIDGLGIQEGLYWALFGMAGVSPEQALALALIARMLTMLAMLPGGWLFAFRMKGSGINQTNPH
jgi:hypothetical protein